MNKSQSTKEEQLKFDEVIKFSREYEKYEKNFSKMAFICGVIFFWMTFPLIDQFVTWVTSAG